MLNLLPLDPACSIEKQLQGTAAPVVLVNLFTVAEADMAALMLAWEKDAAWMKLQPGFLSTQLHRAIGSSLMLMNYAVWESVAQFRAAFAHPEFMNALGAYPSSAVAQPHLFAKVAVPRTGRPRAANGCGAASPEVEAHQRVAGTGNHPQPRMASGQPSRLAAMVSGPLGSNAWDLPPCPNHTDTAGANRTAPRAT